MKQRTEDNGSKNDDWATPEYILDWVRESYGDFFDPCPLSHDTEEWDGLTIDWQPINYVNPPYNNKDKVAFIKKAHQEYLKGNVCVLLLPTTTDIPVFHDLILPFATVLFTRGRVKFKGYNQQGEYVTNKSGQSGSMFVIFDPRKKASVGSFEGSEIQ